MSVALNKNDFTLELLRAKIKWFQTDCDEHSQPSHVSSLLHQNSNGIGFCVSFIKQYFLWNYLRQKRNESRLTVTTDCTLRPCLPLMYRKSKRIEFSVSLNKQYFTIELLRAEVNESRLTVTADCTLRPCLPFMYQIWKGIGFRVSLDQQYFRLELLRARVNEPRQTVTSDCNHRPCLFSKYQNSKDLDLVFHWNSNTFSSITKCWK